MGVERKEGHCNLSFGLLNGVGAFPESHFTYDGILRRIGK